jgi:hypothetical protein
LLTLGRGLILGWNFLATMKTNTDKLSFQVYEANLQ